MTRCISILALVWVACHSPAQAADLVEVPDRAIVLSLEPQTPEILLTAPEARCLEGDWEYYVGGLEKGKASKKAWRTNSLTNETQPLPNLPVPLAYASASVWANYLCVAGGLTHVGRYEFNYDVWIFDPSANEPAWRNLGRLPGPGRIRPAMFQDNGGLYVAGGWLAVETTMGDVVFLPLGSIWQVMPREDFRPVLDKGLPLGSPLTGPAGGDGLLLWQRPAVREVLSLEELLMRRYAIDPAPLRFIPGLTQP